MKNTQNSVINAIKAAIPEALPVPESEFRGYESKGIWFRGSEDYAADNVLIYDSAKMEDEVHPKLEEVLNEHNWHSEPYDSGTLMAYPN